MWWLRFALDYWCTVLAIGTATGRVLLYDPHALQVRGGAGLFPAVSLGAQLRRANVASCAIAVSLAAAGQSRGRTPADLLAQADSSSPNRIPHPQSTAAPPLK